MPTENRSSNTEMVSVPRDLLARVSSTELGMFARKDRYAAASEARAILAQPARQPHPDPIAWMVGTAFWWTKEEAERDAAETGLPIVGLGPMAGVAPAEQHQGEPVALPARKGTHLCYDTLMPTFSKGWNACLDEIAKLGPLYPRPVQDEDRSGATVLLSDHRKGISAYSEHIELLKSQLAKQGSLLARAYDLEGIDGDWLDAYHALSASAEPSAPECSHQFKCARFENGEIVDHVCQDCRQVFPKAEPSAPVERGPWQPLATPGQVQDGDWLSFTVAGRFICAQARLVINPGADKKRSSTTGRRTTTS